MSCTCSFDSCVFEVTYPAPFVNWLLLVTLVAPEAIPSYLFFKAVVKLLSVCEETEKSNVPSLSW